MNLDMTQFHQTFFEESAELLADMEGLLLRLEETPTDLDLLNTIFRCAHSIKGGSATFGFTLLGFNAPKLASLGASMLSP